MPDDRYQRPLTQEEVLSLPEGTKVKVKWGESGFYFCTIKRQGKAVYASTEWGILGYLDASSKAEVWLA